MTTAGLPAVTGAASASRGAGRATAGSDIAFDAALASAAGEERDASSQALADAPRGAAEPRPSSPTSAGERAGRSLSGRDPREAAAAEASVPDRAPGAAQGDSGAEAPALHVEAGEPGAGTDEPRATEAAGSPTHDAIAGLVPEQPPSTPSIAMPAIATSGPGTRSGRRVTDATAAVPIDSDGATSASAASTEAGPQPSRGTGAPSTAPTRPAEGPTTDPRAADHRDAAAVELEAVEPVLPRTSGAPSDDAAALTRPGSHDESPGPARDGVAARAAGETARAVPPAPAGGRSGEAPQGANRTRTGARAEAAAMLAAAIDAAAPRGAGQGSRAADAPAGPRATDGRLPAAPPMVLVPGHGAVPSASAVPVPPPAMDPTVSVEHETGGPGTESPVASRLAPIAQGEGGAMTSGRDRQSGTSLPPAPVLWPAAAPAPGGTDMTGAPVRFVPPGASLPLSADGELASLGPQLIRHLHMQVRDGGGQVRLTLSPEHLGAVTVELRVHQQQVAAMLAADTPAVRGWLSAHEQDLKSGLAELGLHLDELVIRDEDAGRRQQERQEQPRSRGRRTRDAAEQVFDVRV